VVPTVTTVKELIHQLTADYEYDLTTNFTVTATAGVVRIEAS